IELMAPQVLGNVREVYNLGAGSYWSNKEYYETQYKVITSRAVALRVVQLLKLEGNKSFLGIDKLPPEEQKRALEVAPDYVELVRAAISVEPVKDSRMAYVKARHEDPKWSKRLADATVNAYRDYNLQTRREITLEAAGWLADQAKELKVRMEESENALQQFKEDLKVLSVSMEDRQNITSQRLVDLNQTLNQTQAQRIALEARRKLVLDIRENKQPLEAIEKISENQLIRQLKESYFRLKEQQAELGSKYLPDHPKYKAVEEKVLEVKRNIDREMGNALAAIEGEYQTKLEAERGLQRELTKIKAEALEINKHALDYSRLKRVSDNNEALYKLVLSRQKEATLAAHQETNNVYKLDAAVEPTVPVYPRVNLNLLLAAVVGLLLGVGLAFFLEYLDNTVKSQEDLERQLQVAFLGIVPSIKLESPPEGAEVVRLRDHYLISHPKSNVAEACRTVRTNILFLAPENPPRKLLVTSPSPQEGKSTVCINLGITMAQSGSRVVLVDTDMRRPRLHKTFGLKTGAGVTTAILGEAELEQVVHHTDVPGLDVIPCGPVPPNPTELIHTERFRRFLEALAARYDRVIFDSPPVLAVADPLILASLMDGVVLVIKSAQTSREMARRAVRQLRDIKAKVLGAVINDIDLSHRDYGYYYYHQYRTYYGEKEQDAPGQ
ncbi:MAG TPA: polysaccharide biosynthesis tyrosine autokinase, partial [Myxococcota bacterium]|nr:polysaccharide biosynthesis tyrosine autokinase [Myxococcota bacterium]